MIPYHKPSIGDEEINEVIGVLRGGWLTTGACASRLESDFREYVRSPYALAVNSCTAGLHLALSALGIGPGDEVITTPITFCATVNTILHTGARCVLADIGQDGNIDPERIAAKITPRTRAILPVHFAGQPCNMEAIWALARKHNLFVVEDAAHAAGTHYKGHPIGGGLPERGYYSDAVAYSFYATKNLTTGEGGMVTTHDPKLAEKMTVLCLHGIDKGAWSRYANNGKWFYQVTGVGYKYNLSDIHAAIGVHQLRRLESFTERRSYLAGLYNDAFAGIEEVECPPQAQDGRHCWHLYVLRLNLDRLSVNRNDFITIMRDLGVNCSVHFIPIPLHPAYQNNALVELEDSRRGVELYERIVSLPLYPAMSDEDAEQVIHAVQTAVDRTRARRFEVGATV